MRTLVIAALLPLAALAACVSSGRSSMTAERMDQLRQACEARGGMLVPSGRRFTGFEALDYPCVIHGGASRIDDR